jgi:hypothetical protein
MNPVFVRPMGNGRAGVQTKSPSRFPWGTRSRPFRGSADHNFVTKDIARSGIGVQVGAAGIRVRVVHEVPGVHGPTMTFVRWSSKRASLGWDGFG